MNPQKSVLFIANTSWSMYKFRKKVIEELVDKGYQVYIAAPRDSFTKRIIDLGVMFIEVNLKAKSINPISDLKYFFTLLFLLKRISPDYVFQYTIKPNIYGSMASIFIKGKSFAFITGLGYTFINNTLSCKIARLLYKITLRFTEKVIFINQDDRNTFIKNNIIDSNKSILFPGEGVDTNLFTPSQKSNDTFSCSLIARMLWDKGIKEYIEAIKILSKEYPKVIFNLIGPCSVENPQAITLEELDQLTGDCSVNYLGAVEDVRSYIQESSIIVLPSYREGLSMILLESAAMGKPLIATDVPGCREIVNNGINGYLCEVKSSSDLAKKIEMAINLSKDDLLKMGQKSREHITEKFDYSIICNLYSKLMQ